MAASREHQASGLSDALRHLSADASETLFRGILDSKSDHKGFGKLRRSCKALRNFVDGHVRELQVRVAAFNDSVLRRIDAISWLDRWPRVHKLTLVAPVNAEPDILSAPIAALGLATRLRIAEVHIKCNDEEWWEHGYLSSAALGCLLPQLPALHTLTAYSLFATRNAHQGPAPDPFASVPQLRSLTLRGPNWLDPALCGILTDRLLGQLTELRVLDTDPLPPNVDSIDVGPRSDLARFPFVAPRLRAMEQMRELHLEAGLREPFSPMDAAALLRALPASVRRFSVDPVWVLAFEHTTVRLDCRLDDRGFLQTVEVEYNQGSFDVQYGGLCRYLAATFLHSPRLGPRLPRLVVTGPVVIGKPLGRQGPGAALLARCDEVRLAALQEHPDDEWEAWEEWEERQDDAEVARLYAAAVMQAAEGLEAAAAAAARGRGHGRRRRRGRGRQRKRRRKRKQKRRPLASAAARAGSPRAAGAHGRQVTAAPVSRQHCWDSGRPLLLLYGPALQDLLAGSKAEVQAWVKDLSAATKGGSKCNGTDRYWVLSTANALLLRCSNEASFMAAAELARKRLAGGGDGGEASGSYSASRLRALRCTIDLPCALHQVLQELWEGVGAQEAAPGPGSSGGGGGGRGEEGPAARGVPRRALCGRGDLERLRWLLETAAGMHELRRCHNTY
ncbi:hypothetical protein HYH03_013557 [Edaphochlamys debaryana]|uniref:Uncharacterized protein n=1 Tax=Edaphochlamys debaryana TaxID=47281 RepID=A0A836BT16_9CHLO|nr:hypothetical protein HYH03_013557 [Edaphochlamys debaryana]|eukprot:KAG2487840.1 hypothetical protein HYH03_013557 [Edaphochlamys debaryana]